MTANTKGTSHADADAQADAHQAAQTEATQGAEAAKQKTSPASARASRAGAGAVVSAPARRPAAKRPNGRATQGVGRDVGQPAFHGDEHHGKGGKYRFVDGKRKLVEATSPAQDAGQA